MERETFFVNVWSNDIELFDEYVKRNNLKVTSVSSSIFGDILSSMYTVSLTAEEEVSLKLTFDLKGFINLTRINPKRIVDSIVN